MNAAVDVPPTIGNGAWRYRFEREWAKLPRWWSFGVADANASPPRTALKGAVAANGDVYVLSRSAHPVCVFDPEGRFVSAWGEGQFSVFVHGLTIAPDQQIWITNSGTHLVSVHEPSGEMVDSFGTRGVASPTLYGAPFNMPTGVAFASNGDFFISDGYGNRRVHHYAAGGSLLHSWGEPGRGPGQFAIVHFIAIDDRDRVHIADRENHRIQVFDTTGAFLSEWSGFDMPSDLAFGSDAIYVGGRDGLSIWTRDHAPIARWHADEPYPGAFNIHGIWLDADENIYLAHFDRAVSKLTRLR